MKKLKSLIGKEFTLLELDNACQAICGNELSLFDYEYNDVFFSKNEGTFVYGVDGQQKGLYNVYFITQQETSGELDHDLIVEVTEVEKI